MSARTVAAAAAGAMAGIVAFALFIAAQATGPTTGPASIAPNATAAAAPSVDGSFAVWDRNPDGTPVRWDPCTPIGWVLDDRLAPAGTEEVVLRAVDRIATATGLTFEYRGTTTEPPSRDRPLVTDEDEWRPVLVTWVRGGSVDLPLGDAERGVTVPVAVRDGGPRVFVTGQVLLNADKTLLPGFEDRHASWGAVVLHELGHLVGLDHVEDARELMHATPGFGPVELGAGDRAGLAAVGADGGCLDQPDPQELEVRFD